MVQDKQWSIFEGIVPCKVEIDKRSFLKQSALERLLAVAISYAVNWKVLGFWFGWLWWFFGVLFFKALEEVALRFHRSIIGKLN